MGCDVIMWLCCPWALGSLWPNAIDYHRKSIRPYPPPIPVPVYTQLKLKWTCSWERRGRDKRKRRFRRIESGSTSSMMNMVWHTPFINVPFFQILWGREIRIRGIRFFRDLSLCCGESVDTREEPFQSEIYCFYFSGMRGRFFPIPIPCSANQR